MLAHRPEANLWRNAAQNQIPSSSSNRRNKSAPGPLKLWRISFSATALTICLSSFFLPLLDEELGVKRLDDRDLDSCTSPRVSRLATTSLNSVFLSGCSSPSSCLHRVVYFIKSSVTDGALFAVLVGVMNGFFSCLLVSLLTMEHKTAFCCKFSPANLGVVPLLKMLDVSLAICATVARGAVSAVKLRGNFVGV